MQNKIEEAKKAGERAAKVIWGRCFFGRPEFSSKITDNPYAKSRPNAEGKRLAAAWHNAFVDTRKQKGNR